MSQTYDEWIEITEDIDDKLMSDTLETDLKENLDIVKNNIKLLETITDDCTLDFYEKIMDDISRIY